ncbi:MAG: hypothetical protein FWD87_07435 [Spirochaetaceae bacterium]|nr:hypothetical protein [Spirochaetaceae bacterium]
MTIAQRNNTLLFIIGISVTILILLALAPYFLYKIGEIESIDLAYKKLWTSNNYIFGFSLVLYSVISLFILRFSFYKTNSAEVFFFMVYLVTLIFESSRSFILILEELNSSFVYTIFLSRVAYFSKMCGFFALFLSALASSDIRINKFNILTIIIVAISLMFSSAIPLSDNMLDNSYYMPGFFYHYFFTLLFIGFLAILIFVINYFQKRSSEYFYLALGMMFIIIGREITFYMASIPYFSGGMVFMIGGTILFSYKLREIYKWD